MGTSNNKNSYMHFVLCRKGTLMQKIRLIQYKVCILSKNKTTNDEHCHGKYILSGFSPERDR